MLSEPAVLDANDVGGNPGGGSAIPGEAPVRDHVIALCDDELVLVFQRAGQGADQVEQTIAARRDMGAVLDVAIRPETLGGVVVAPVEQRVEGFENERLAQVWFWAWKVSCRCGSGHDRRQTPRAPACGQYERTPTARTTLRAPRVVQTITSGEPRDRVCKELG